MKILVTGGAGFIGTNLIERLLKDGHDVTSIDNYSTGSKLNHIKGCNYLEYDITKIHSYDWINPDVIFHLAAIARIQPSFSEPLNYFNVNISGTANILEWASKNNVPVVFAGSSSKWSGRFKNPYTFSKDVGEDMIELYQKIYGLKATIARFYNVYGPYHLKEGGYETVIAKWEKAVEDGTPITIYGDGTKRRDFTHVYDIIDALVTIVEKNAWGNDFELGRGINFSLKEVADMFKYDNIEFEDDKPGEALETLNTDTKAKELLNWSPYRNLQDWIIAMS